MNFKTILCILLLSEIAVRSFCEKSQLFIKFNSEANPNDTLFMAFSNTKDIKSIVWHI